MKKITIVAALLSGAVFNPALAAEKTVELQSFTAINAQKGINLTIKCAEKTSLKVKGTQSAIDKLNINYDDNKLNLLNEYDNILSKAVDITLYTNNPLNNLSTMAGVKMKVDTCAVDSENLAVSGMMGSSINIAGKTKHLDLNLEAGADFNQTSTQFSADTANIKLSMGAQAALCHIPQITGNLTAGTSIEVSKNANVKITNNFASEISRDNCP
ncbi:hypothetical protein Xmau_04105 [Xenorhabdus mauleonii]|uniref:Putative auto-transporter adhesin head GIN domain-containing protein n=1 Tax=Xenorhabdus mauleonii TaxID=351675 RepID=A0A1I3W9Z9_9GAMM|nr:DUF2807 domain-containing protein [Xenorhabdus mauleonii]PHM36742.1 hypothetical protein Xmau_04105 [Xenorhabdus mauleonii]SFK04023.1 hypothetical protein SAMN05421680_1259 [Xenorhabdus mauleonii]